MTNEELNTALYKKVFAEAFVKERNEALFSLDRKKIEAWIDFASCSPSEEFA